MNWEVELFMIKVKKWYWVAYPPKNWYYFRPCPQYNLLILPTILSPWFNYLSLTYNRMIPRRLLSKRRKSWSSHSLWKLKWKRRRWRSFDDYEDFDLVDDHEDDNDDYGEVGDNLVDHSPPQLLQAYDDFHAKYPDGEIMWLWWRRQCWWQ